MFVHSLVVSFPSKEPAARAMNRMRSPVSFAPTASLRRASAMRSLCRRSPLGGGVALACEGMGSRCRCVLALAACGDGSDPTRASGGAYDWAGRW